MGTQHGTRATTPRMDQAHGDTTTTAREAEVIQLRALREKSAALRARAQRRAHFVGGGEPSRSPERSEETPRFGLFSAFLALVFAVLFAMFAASLLSCGSTARLGGSLDVKVPPDGPVELDGSGYFDWGPLNTRIGADGVKVCLDFPFRSCLKLPFDGGGVDVEIGAPAGKLDPSDPTEPPDRWQWWNLRGETMMYWLKAETGGKGRVNAWAAVLNPRGRRPGRRRCVGNRRYAEGGPIRRRRSCRPARGPAVQQLQRVIGTGYRQASHAALSLKRFPPL